MSDPVNTRDAFRDALGSFATGVTIATTLDANGEPVGVTASSFNSVSLNPPLVLWSLAKNSLSREAFCGSGHFAVHVLAANQEELSNRFARSGEDKFGDVEWALGGLGSPILAEHAALFECETRHQYEGGDHIIFVGEVKSFEACEVAPLLFHAGNYAESRPRAATQGQHSVDLEHGQFNDNFLFHLITRAHFQTSRPMRDKIGDLDLSMAEYMTLTLLSTDTPLGESDLIDRLSHTGHAPDHALLARMVQRGLIHSDGRAFDLAEQGRELFIETLAFSKALEADLADHFSEQEISEAKRILRRIIELTASS